MILKDTDIYPALLMLLNNEKQTSAVFAEARQSLNEIQLKELVTELEQCARQHHGLIYDYLQKNTTNTDRQWLKAVLLLEQQNHCLYNALMTQFSNPAIKQMLKQLRDDKMRSITLLQQQLSQLEPSN